MNPRVLLLSPPWRPPDEPCLALATLAPWLEQHGLPCDAVHSTLLFPPTPTPSPFLASYGAHVFAPLLGADPDAAVDGLLARVLEDLQLQGIVAGADLAAFGKDAAAMRADAHANIARARTWLDRAVAVVRPEHDIVGLSVTFESQLPAALALALALERRHPGVHVIFGGPACFGPAAQAIVEAWPVDAVCTGEGDDVIVPLVRALRAGTSLDAVPGIAHAGGLTASPPLPRDLDRLPMPSYAGYLAELAASPWADVEPKLFFEWSRGCWWGQKSLCTFCGLNADGIAFRSKSPERAVAEVAVLRALTGGRLQLTDNILDMAYWKTVLPALQAVAGPEDRPLRIFAEIKSNLRRDQVHALSRAGIDLVQPGIESLHDGVLTLMAKGCTGLGQLQFLKYAAEAELGVVYNLLLSSPGEQAAWYDTMTALLDAVWHLPPPAHVTPVWIERFAPYQTAPAKHGITALRPKPWYAELYPGADPERLAYVFDYDHPDQGDTALLAAHRRFVARVADWQQRWQPWLCFFVEEKADIVVVDRRSGVERVSRLEGGAAELFRHLGRVRSSDSVHRDLPDDAGLIDELIARRWVVGDEVGRLLCVVPQTSTQV